MSLSSMDAAQQLDPFQRAVVRESQRWASFGTACY